MHEILTCLALAAPAADWAAYSRTTGVLLSTGSNVWWQLSSHQPRKGVRWMRGLRRTITSARKISRARKWKEINSKFLSRCLPHTHTPNKQTISSVQELQLPFFEFWELNLQNSEDGGDTVVPVLKTTEPELAWKIPAWIPCGIFYDKELGTYAIPIFFWLTLILLP